jgi:signal transduction histidine kinase
MQSTFIPQDDPARAPAIAQRLLACYQQVLGHDLPNKLVALQGFAQVLERELPGEIGDEARDCLNRLIAISREVHVHISALADVGRACRKVEALTPVCLDDLWPEIQAAVNYQQPGCIVITRDGPLPTLLLPRAAVSRALLEILLFAARRAAADSPVRVQVSWSCPTARSTCLHLRENGPALSVTQRKQAFEPGIPASGSPPALGLFLARLLAEGWGGALELSSPPEGGCVYILEIPHSPMIPSTGT